MMLQAPSMRIPCRIMRVVCGALAGILGHRAGSLAFAAEAQTPVVAAREIGKLDDADLAGADAAAPDVEPRAVAHVEPLRAIGGVEARAAHPRPGAALLKVGEEDVPVRRARTVGPAFVAERVMGLVGRNEVGQRNKLRVALPYREREGPQELHLRAGGPPERIPHLRRRRRLDVGAPDALGAVDVPRESAGEEAAVEAGPAERVVALRAAGPRRACSWRSRAPAHPGSRHSRARR